MFIYSPKKLTLHPFQIEIRHYNSKWGPSKARICYCWYVSLVLDLYLFICFEGNVLLADVINGLDILADQLEQEAKKTTVYEVELAPGFGTVISEIRNPRTKT